MEYVACKMTITQVTKVRMALTLSSLPTPYNIQVADLCTKCSLYLGGAEGEYSQPRLLVQLLELARRQVHVVFDQHAPRGPPRESIDVDDPRSDSQENGFA